MGIFAIQACGSNGTEMLVLHGSSPAVVHLAYTYSRNLSPSPIARCPQQQGTVGAQHGSRDPLARLHGRLPVGRLPLARGWATDRPAWGPVFGTNFLTGIL